MSNNSIRMLNQYVLGNKDAFSSTPIDTNFENFSIMILNAFSPRRNFWKSSAVDTKVNKTDLKDPNLGSSYICDIN